MFLARGEGGQFPWFQQITMIHFSLSFELRLRAAR